MGTEFAGEFTKLCKAEGIQIYSTMSETKAAFADTIPENYTLPFHGKQWIQVHSQIDSIRYNTKFLRNCSIDLTPKNVENSDFLSILYSQPLREFRKPKLNFGDRVRISKYDITFRKGYTPQFTKEVFEIVTISSQKPPTYTIRDKQDKIIRGKFHQKELIKVI